MLGWTIGLFLAALTLMIHYEVAELSVFLRARYPKGKRVETFQTVLMFLVAHVLEIVIFAAAYFVCANWFELGEIQGGAAQDFADLVYFSAATYTTVGYGDIVVTGDLRPIASLEALVGLLLIAWTGAFTVIFLHRHRRR